MSMEHIITTRITYQLFEMFLIIAPQVPESFSFYRTNAMAATWRDTRLAPILYYTRVRGSFFYYMLVAVITDEVTQPWQKVLQAFNTWSGQYVKRDDIRHEVIIAWREMRIQRNPFYIYRCPLRTAIWNAHELQWKDMGLACAKSGRQTTGGLFSFLMEPWR